MNPTNTLQYPGLFPINKLYHGGYPVFAWFIIFMMCLSCSTDKEEPAALAGRIIFTFDHSINHQPVVFDSLMYENAAGNLYLVNEIQYFISDVTLYGINGKVKRIDEWKAIHYVDTDIESTHTWEVYDPIDPGLYDSIGFMFGFTEERNMSFMFVNPPEKDMFWPEFLGGGYHYLKLNGKWLPEGQTIQTAPFDFHLGKGQIYHTYPDSITGFIHNNFNVSLPASDFEIAGGEIKTLNLTMQVDKWFTDPYVYNHDVYGGYIMQNQEAMQIVKKNGHNVFLLNEAARK